MRNCALLAALGLGLVTAIVVRAATQPNTSEVAAPPSAAVAREIVKIQEQLGGSIVTGSELDALAPRTAAAAPLPASSPVAALRDAAWQLDNSAHQLETVELYQRADDLRALAGKLRQEARDFRQVAKKPE